MADYRVCNPSNETDTCLWCGRKLHYIKGRYVTTDKGRVYNPEAVHEKSGSYFDGFFCGLRCGYQFAVKFANWGRRITLSR